MIFLVLLLLLGLAFRLREFVFVLGNIKEGNFLTCHDCYFYADLAHKKLEGYGLYIDRQRNVPDFVPLDADTLTAFLPAYLSKLSGVPIEYFLAFMPPILSMLFAVPLYLWIRRFSDTCAFVGAFTAGLFNYMYWARTLSGRYDTDFLILFFLFTTLYLVTRSLEEVDLKKQVAYSALAGLSLNLFMSWYPKSVIFFLFLASFSIGVFVFKRSPLLLAVFFLSGGPEIAMNIFRDMTIYIESRIFEKPTVSFVPFNMASFVGELQDMNLGLLLFMTNKMLPFLGSVGLVLFFLRHARYALVALPFIVLGLATFLGGVRLLIYLAPFLGLGAGLIVSLLVRKLKESVASEGVRRILILAGPILAFFAGFSPSIGARYPHPTVPKEYFGILSWIKENTEREAYLWMWWEYGHAAKFLTERGVYIDNGNWNIVKSFAYARSMVTHDEEESYKLVSYVTNEVDLSGRYRDKTYKDFLKDALSYSRPLSSPVYVVTFREFTRMPAVLALGSLDIQPLENFTPLTVVECASQKGNFRCPEFTVEGESIKLSDSVSEAYFLDKEKDRFETLRQKTDPSPEDVIVVAVKNGGKFYQVITSRNLFETVIVRLFLGLKGFENFSLVYDDFPHGTVYRVKFKGYGAQGVQPQGDRGKVD